MGLLLEGAAREEKGSRRALHFRRGSISIPAAKWDGPAGGREPGPLGERGEILRQTVFVADDHIQMAVDELSLEIPLTS